MGRRWHPLREEWIIVAAHRQDRPWSGSTLQKGAPVLPPYVADCYLCREMRASAARSILNTVRHTFSVTITRAYRSPLRLIFKRQQVFIRIGLPAIDDEIVHGALGPPQSGKALCFEDQYTSTADLRCGREHFDFIACSTGKGRELIGCGSRSDDGSDKSL